jgi:hypothetical protein
LKVKQLNIRQTSKEKKKEEYLILLKKFFTLLCGKLLCGCRCSENTIAIIININIRKIPAAITP